MAPAMLMMSSIGQVILGSVSKASHRKSNTASIPRLTWEPRCRQRDVRSFQSLAWTIELIEPIALPSLALQSWSVNQKRIDALSTDRKLQLIFISLTNILLITSLISLLSNSLSKVCCFKNPFRWLSVLNLGQPHAAPCLAGISKSACVYHAAILLNPFLHYVKFCL